MSIPGPSAHAGLCVPKRGKLSQATSNNANGTRLRCSNSRVVLDAHHNPDIVSSTTRNRLLAPSRCSLSSMPSLVSDDGFSAADSFISSSSSISLSHRKSKRSNPLTLLELTGDRVCRPNEQHERLSWVGNPFGPNSESWISKEAYGAVFPSQTVVTPELYLTASMGSKTAHLKRSKPPTSRPKRPRQYIADIFSSRTEGAGSSLHQTDASSAQPNPSRARTLSVTSIESAIEKTAGNVIRLARKMSFSDGSKVRSLFSQSLCTTRSTTGTSGFNGSVILQLNKQLPLTPPGSPTSGLEKPGVLDDTQVHQDSLIAKDANNDVRRWGFILDSSLSLDDLSSRAPYGDMFGGELYLLQDERTRGLVASMCQPLTRPLNRKAHLKIPPRASTELISEL